MRAWLPALAWMALIFAFSSFPMPPGTEDVPDWLTHPAAWFVLSVLVAHALHANRAGRVLPLAFAICVAWGIADELHQSFVPGRTPDVLDVVKDAGGTVLGLLAWTLRLRRMLSPEVT